MSNFRGEIVYPKVVQFQPTVKPSAPDGSVWLDEASKNLQILRNGTASSLGSSLSVINASDFGVTANGQAVFDAQITNGSNVVSSASASFSSADIGKIIFGTTGPQAGFSGGGPDSLSVLALPQGTITGILSSTSVTVSSTGNSSASGSADGVLLWGSDDSAGLTASWNAATANPHALALQLPAGLMFTQMAQFLSPSNSASRNEITGPVSLGITVSGWGKLSSLIVPTPDFDFTTATGKQNSCFFGSDGISVNNLGIWGGGYNNVPSNSKTIMYNGNDGYVTHVIIAGWGANTAGMVGLVAAQYIDDVIIIGGGGTGLQASSPFGSGAANLFMTRCYVSGCNFGHLQVEANVSAYASASYFAQIQLQDPTSTFFDMGYNTLGGLSIAPTASVTGAGSDATATLDSTDTNEAGTITITAGTSPSSTGVLTLTFLGNFAINGGSPICNFTFANGTGSWDARASAIVATRSKNSITVNWDNNSTNLVNGSTYKILYQCYPG